jgi:hypothetical protein
MIIKFPCFVPLAMAGYGILGKTLKLSAEMDFISSQIAGLGTLKHFPQPLFYMKGSLV